MVAGRGSRVASRGSKVAVTGPMSRQGKMIWGSRFKSNVSPPFSSYLRKEFILGVCVQEVFQQAFSLFCKKTVKFERPLVSSTDRLVAFRFVVYEVYRTFFSECIPMVTFFQILLCISIFKAEFTHNWAR